MFLGITILGWIIIAAVYGPLLIAFALLRRRIGGARAQALVLAVLLLPLAAAVAEAVYIDWRFRSLCKEAGVLVKKRVEADGYFDGRGRDWSKSPSDFLKTGFRYIEWQDSSNTFHRIERAGEVAILVPIERPTAKYQYVPARAVQRVAHRVEASHEKIIEIQSQEVLGRSTTVYRYPALVDLLWWRFFDPIPTFCPTGVSSLRDSVLVPSLTFENR